MNQLTPARLETVLLIWWAHAVGIEKQVSFHALARALHAKAPYPHCETLAAMRDMVIPHGEESYLGFAPGPCSAFRLLPGNREHEKYQPRVKILPILLGEQEFEVNATYDVETLIAQAPKDWQRFLLRDHKTERLQPNRNNKSSQILSRVEATPEMKEIGSAPPSCWSQSELLELLLPHDSVELPTNLSIQERIEAYRSYQERLQWYIKLLETIGKGMTHTLSTVTQRLDALEAAVEALSDQLPRPS